MTPIHQHIWYRSTNMRGWRNSLRKSKTAPPIVTKASASTTRSRSLRKTTPSLKQISSSPQSATNKDSTATHTSHQSMSPPNIDDSPPPKVSIKDTRQRNQSSPLGSFYHSAFSERTDHTCITDIAFTILYRHKPDPFMTNGPPRVIPQVTPALNRSSLKDISDVDTIQHTPPHTPWRLRCRHTLDYHIATRVGKRNNRNGHRWLDSHWTSQWITSQRYWTN